MLKNIEYNMYRLIKIFPAIILLIMPFSFASAACIWREKKTAFNIHTNSNYTIGGCQGNEYEELYGDCSIDSKPSGDSVCCCQETVVAETKIPAAAPRFQMPEMQINIGAKFTEPNCVQGENGLYVCSINWLGEYLSAIYDYALKIGGLLAAVILMAGGALWLVSGGDASRISQAKNLITGSITGLILLLSTYLILIQVNPELIRFRPISMGSIASKQVDDIIKSKSNNAASSYAQMNCARDEELINGTDFYATGYCKPAWEDSDKFRCFIAMNCSCPNGRDTSKNCDKWFGSTYPGYAPCLPFSADTAYCNRTASGAQPTAGTIAAPDCENLRFGTEVCFNGKTYTVSDRGSGIQGRRIDIWTGNDCGAAAKVTGVGKLTLGRCQ